MRVLSLIAAAVAVALGTAACGGSSHTSQFVGPASSGTATVSSSTATTATEATTATATAPHVLSTASTPATTSAPQTVTTETITAPDSGGAGLTTGSSGARASSQCVAADLSATALPPNSAPGVTALGFTLKNTGAHACESGAYPGIALITASGTVVDVATTRTTKDDLGATPVTRIDLAPGEEMSFRLTLHDSNSAGGGCASYGGVQIIPPNDTATLKVSIPDGPVQSCGSVGVSAVEPGASATGQ